MTGRVGVFGGTFDPLHRAHVRVAECALAQFGLSEVVFVPSGIPPHKSMEGGATSGDRYEMVRRALAGQRGFAVSRIEIDRDGPSYTIDTLRQMGAQRKEGLCFIVGADRLLDITTWKEPEALLTCVPFVLAPRHGRSLEAFAAAPFDRAEIHFLDMEEVDLSSTWLRQRIAQGASYKDAVPPAVAAYIEAHRLYRHQPTTVHP